MTKLRVTNESDETIEIPPGKTIEIFGEQASFKTTVARVKEFVVFDFQEIKFGEQ